MPRAVSKQDAYTLYLCVTTGRCHSTTCSSSALQCEVAHRQAEQPQDEQQQDEQQREGQQHDEQADAAARDPQDALHPARDLNPLRLYHQDVGFLGFGNRAPPPIPSPISGDLNPGIISCEPAFGGGVQLHQ